ncbi:MAG: ferrous iron transport protein A [Desulfococcaceae bacterium]
MVLAEVPVGKRVKILAANCGRRFQSRLADLGLLPGAEVQVVANVPGRPLVVSLNGSRLALCGKMAGKIPINGNGDENPVCPRRPACKELPDACPGGPGPAGPCRGNHICLRQMQVNQKGIIRCVRAKGELGRRIRDMGLVPNTEVTVVGRAPLKDPVALRLRDFTLTLRNNEADFITVEVSGG